jgi:hypothetical protein
LQLLTESARRLKGGWASPAGNPPPGAKSEEERDADIVMGPTWAVVGITPCGAYGRVVP